MSEVFPINKDIMTKPGVAARCSLVVEFHAGSGILAAVLGTGEMHNATISSRCSILWDVHHGKLPALMLKYAKCSVSGSVSGGAW